MLKVEHIKKSYQNFSLDCSLEVKPGSVTGLIGQNGAGKSTTFKAILGLISIDAGNITIFGKNVTDFNAEDKEKLGVVLSDSGFSGYLTIKDLLPILQSFYKNFDSSFFMEKVQKFQLPLDKKMKEFSTGMKAKLKVLAAISHDAKLLILDEPTVGLDVIARDELLDMLREFMEIDENRSILISSHISSDLESLCDDIYMIHGGNVILHEDTDVLLSDYAILKADEKQYADLDKQYILCNKKESYGYSCLTNQKQYYYDNYPQIVIEKGSIDEVISMMIRGLNYERFVNKGLLFNERSEKLLFLIIAVTLGITVFGDDMTFALGFLTFVVSLFSLSTISYDEFDNGNAFLFTLPFTRTRYAVEKYVLALLLGGAGWILSTGTVILVNVYKDVLSISDITISAFMIIPAMLIIQAIMIPFHLKFGGEKGRLAIIGALGVVFALGAVIVKIADGMNVNLTTMLNGLTTINVTTMLVILFLIALLIWGISMMISISVMRKKEF